jgi:hypothetical protein
VGPDQAEEDERGQRDEARLAAPKIHQSGWAPGHRATSITTAVTLAPKERPRSPPRVGLICATVSAFMVSAVSPRFAGAVEAEVFGRARAFYDRLPDAFAATRLTREPVDTPGASERLSAQLFAAGRIWGQPVPGLVLQLGLDTGLIDVSGDGVFGDGRELDRHAAETLFLGETFVDVQPLEDGSFLLRAGKLRPRFGRGAIFDAYAFGARADWDLRLTDRGPPLRFELWGGVPSARFDDTLKQSPLLHARVTVEPVTALELAGLGAVLFDNDDALQTRAASAFVRRAGSVWDGASEVADVVFDDIATLLEEDTGTRGTVGWAGVELGWHRRGWSVELTALLSFGRFTTTIDDAAAAERLDALNVRLDRLAAFIPDPGDRARRIRQNRVAVEQLSNQLSSAVDGVDRSLFGGFVLLETNAPLTSWLDAHGFFIWASGEDGLEFANPDDGLGGYVGIAPLLPLTDIFFSGSTAPSQQTPTFASVAPEGSGVLGFGLGPRMLLGPVELDAVAAVLWSDVPPPDRPGDRFFGIEANLGATVFLGRNFHLFAEGAVFATGDYFGGAPAAVQVFGGFGGEIGTMDGDFGL